MPWISINPKSISDEVMEVATEILRESPDHYVIEGAPLDSQELADAFNVLDPEVCQLTKSTNQIDEED